MNKRKIIILIIAVIIIIIALVTVLGIINSNKIKTSIADFRNVKELVEYYDCTYISMKNSKEDGFNKDINITFGIEPIDKNGVSNKLKFERIISSIAGKMDFKDFRIIDEAKNITVRAKFNEEGKITYTINNDVDYFLHVASKYSTENVLEEKDSNIIINSQVLLAIIGHNWRTTNLNLGTIDSTVDKYDIYFDEGYKIRKINGKVYNIVFTDKYEMQVINGITTSSSIQQIRQVLGNETYKGEGESANVIGYKNSSAYVFFGNNQISIYPNNVEQNSEEFANLITNLINTNNKKEFLSKLTDVWPDYSSYTNDGNDVTIRYPLKGVQVDFTLGSQGNITIYSNYKGKITDSMTIEDIKEQKILPTYINLALDNNMVLQEEVARVNMENRKRYPLDREETLQTSKYVVYLYENRCEFYSKNGEDIDSSIEVQGLKNIYELNDSIFVYSIKGKGIYAYQANLKRETAIVTGNDDYNIVKIEDGVIYYDDATVRVL